MLRYMPYEMAARDLFAGNTQALDEAILFDDLPARVKLAQSMLYVAPPEVTEFLPATLSRDLASWPLKKFTGWFRIPPNSAEAIIMAGHGKFVCVLSRSKMHGHSNWAFFGSSNDSGDVVLAIRETTKAELWIWSEDFEKWRTLRASPEPKDQKTRNLGTKERTSYLRIIDALIVMNRLPERGATASVEKQIQELGYDGPIDDTIREILKEARERRPK